MCHILSHHATTNGWNEPQNIRYQLLSFFFNDTATTEIYTLSLHDALPIWESLLSISARSKRLCLWPTSRHRDRKSTRLNSSHVSKSYAVFCLKKKKRS